MGSPKSALPLPALKDIRNLLHLTYHRNKNQHRIAKWWKALGVLRRQVGKLIAEGEAAERGVTNSRIKIGLRIQFLIERVVPDCFINFTRVIADNQYSALGLMLLGTLASLQRILALFNQNSVGEETIALKTKVAKSVSGVENDRADGEDVGESVSREVDEDVGERIERTRRVDEGGVKRAWSKAEKIEEREKDVKPAKKKKKKGDAIDDLFSGLL